MIPLDFSIAFQIGDACFDESDLSQSSLTLYFDLRMDMHKLSLLETTIQPSFAKRELLMCLAFLNLMPPSLVGQHRLSNAFQAKNMPSCCFGFHQNLLVMESSLSQTLLGMLKVDMV